MTQMDMSSAPGKSSAPAKDILLAGQHNTAAGSRQRLSFPSLNIYRRFLESTPDYLARHYWWAYLWPKSVWFFDHQVIINAILFGNYRKLMQATMAQMPQIAPDERALQLTCVFGELTPTIAQTITPNTLHIADAAQLQLDLAKQKVPEKGTLLPVRMNAEHLAYADNSFNALVLFFLLHEMPLKARINVLSECMRVIPEGGTLLVTEYAPLPRNHFLYRFALTRKIITKLEPFLARFWEDDVAAMLNTHGQAFGKQAVIESDERFFAKFYRVTRFKIIRLD